MTRRSRLGYPLFLVVASGILLLAIEGGARLMGRVHTGEWPVTAAVAEYRDNLEVHRLFRRHPWLNVAGEEGAQAEVQGKSARLDSAGYRSPERPLAKPPGVLRVLCVGGSTTFDSLADRNETTWPWRLEEALRQRGLPVEVWNAGLPTWTSLENTIALLSRDLELEPDVIVLLQGFNDLQPASHEPPDPTYEHGHSERMLSALGFELEAPGVLERSVALERLRRRLAGSETRAANREAPRLATGVSEAGLATYRRNLRTFVAIARAWDVAVLVVTQPLRPSPAETARDRRFLAEWLGMEGDAVEGALARINGVLLEVAAKKGEEGVDALDAASAAWADEDFWDPVHFGTMGSEKMAALLVEPVAALLERREDRQEPAAGAAP